MPRSPAASLPLLLAAALVFSGCATNTPENAPLERWNPDAGYRTPKGYDSGDVLLVLALSGGGTRAASLAYGALFTFLGVVFLRRAMVAAVAYTCVIEVIVTLIPATIEDTPPAVVVRRQRNAASRAGVMPAPTMV